MNNNKVRFTFNKVFRDTPSALMFEPGIEIHKKTLNPDEFITELKRKLVEESHEVIAAHGDELIEDLADLFEILDVLIGDCKIKKGKLDTIRQEKLEKRGGFNKRLFFEYVDVPRNSKLYDYCMQQPDKYPMQELKQTT